MSPSRIACTQKWVSRWVDQKPWATYEFELQESLGQDLEVLFEWSFDILGYVDKKTYTLMFLCWVSSFFMPVLCHCYPDLHVCIRVSSDYSLAAPVLWPEVDLELALKRSRKWFSQPNKMTLEMKKKVDNPTKSMIEAYECSPFICYSVQFYIH